MSGTNRVVLIGNVTRNADIRTLPGGTTVCEFSLAINSREKVNGEWQDRADFFDVVCYGEMAEELGPQITKGSTVGTDGRLRQRRWEKDGQKRSKIEVVAANVDIIESKTRPEPVTASDDAPI